MAAEEEPDFSPETWAAIAEYAQEKADDTLTTTRRDFAKAGGALGLGALLGGGGMAASTQSASADASTTDSDGDVGGPSNRVDGFFDGVDATSVNAGGQNNTDINLTRLVENGTYTDIVDAIVNAPPNYSENQRFVIEPGIYTATGGYNLTWDGYEIVAKGHNNNWKPAAGDRPPVVIKFDTATYSGGAITINASGGNLRGGGFKGIQFRPQTIGNGTTGIMMEGGGNIVFGYTFTNCSFYGWGGKPIDRSSALGVFYTGFDRCNFDTNGDTALLGSQTVAYNPVCMAYSGTGAAIKFGLKSSAFGIITEETIEGSASSWLHFTNSEGPGDGTGTGVILAGNDPMLVTGSINGWDIGIDVQNGAVINLAHMNNISSYKLQFSGSTNSSHRGSANLVPIAPNDVNNVNGVYIEGLIFLKTMDNVSSADFPNGGFGIDTNRGGTGNRAIVAAPQNAKWYWDADGQI